MTALETDRLILRRLTLDDAEFMLRLVNDPSWLRYIGDRAPGSVLASDAFFPFPDGLERAAEAGVTAVIQPGGSLRDEEVIRAADERGLAMVFTGMRHFRH